MFDNLSDKLIATLKKVRGQAKITEDNISESLREIRLSLLEADVHFKVVKSFLDKVKEKALGQNVLLQLNAGEQFVKIVHDELVQVLGGETPRLEFKSNPSVILLLGLQGVGKTTTAAKLALFTNKKLSKRVGLVSADVYRPAAMEQLKLLAEKTGTPFLEVSAQEKPTSIAKKTLDWAKQQFLEVIIFDTAGRLQIDDQLMTELMDLKSILKPDEVLLVADSMLGQQSVTVAEGFHQKMGLTGLILTKVDGDARGGAALSIRETLGLPIKFLGTGEKSEALEIFHPDRLAQRILGMGDVMTLVEKAQEVIDQKSAEQAAKRMARNEFSVEDFLTQIRQIKKLGSMESILGMLPGVGQMMKQAKNMAPPDQELKKIEAIISSMTKAERHKHDILNGSRRLRIAKGSGTQVSDVNRFIKQFEQAKKMMSQMMKMGLGRGGKGMGFPF